MINISFDQIIGVPVKLFSYLSNRSRKTPAQVVFRVAFQIQKEVSYTCKFLKTSLVISHWRQLFLLFYAEARKSSSYSQKSVRIFFFLLRGGLISGSGDFWGDSADFFSGSLFSAGGWYSVSKKVGPVP